MSEDGREATKIMLIRHAEKPPSEPPPAGVTAEGERESESLTVRGWQRAGALVCLFAPSDGRFADPLLARPQFLYASQPVKRKGSRRPLETITPLAEKLAIRVNTHFERGETADMVDEVFLCRGVVLICWQREFIPEIAARILGVESAAPREWPEDRFDMTWVFDLDTASGRYRFRQVPQMLLMGDWATPIR